MGKIKRRMALTFPGRRMLMNQKLPLVDIKSEYPSLFAYNEVRN